jgi:uncharacterized protein
LCFESDFQQALGALPASSFTHYEGEQVKYYAAIQSVLSPEKAETVRQAHVEFLARMVAERHIYARGRFPDGSGGLTIYQAETLEEARKLAEADPYVMHGVRRLELREWAMKVGS